MKKETKNKVTNINVSITVKMKKQIIESLKNTTYLNLSEFVRDSIRRRLEEI